LKEDTKIAEDYGVGRDDVFIISRCQGFETDSEDSLMVKFAPISFDIVKAKRTNSFFASIKAWVFSSIFKDNVDQRHLQDIKFYICAEIPARLLRDEHVVTAALKEAAVIVVKNGKPEPVKIVDNTIER
jgi:hypothetical protein